MDQTEKTITNLANQPSPLDLQQVYCGFKHPFVFRRKCHYLQVSKQVSVDHILILSPPGQQHTHAACAIDLTVGSTGAGKYLKTGRNWSTMDSMLLRI